MFLVMYFSLFCFLQNVLCGQTDSSNRNWYKDSVDKTGKESSSNFILSLMNKVDRLESKVGKLERFQNETIQSLYKSIEPDGQMYWNTTTGCGGSIQAQNGRIYGQVYNSGTTYYSVRTYECMWTIQSNQRSWIKLSLITKNSLISDSGKMSLCEVKEFVINEGNFGDSQTLISTKIDQLTPYLFRGPLIFLICNVSTGLSKQDYVEFEGLGLNSFENINFNFKFQSGMGDFEYPLQTNSNNDKNSPIEFLMVVWPGSTYNLNKDLVKNMILENFDSHKVCDFMSLNIYPDFTNTQLNNLSSIDCCKVNCSLYTFIISDRSFLATIGINRNQITETTMNINPKFSLEARENSSTDYSFTSGCGGLVSGRRSGKISKSYSERNSRCVWIINPIVDMKLLVSGTGFEMELAQHRLIVVEILENGLAQTKKYESTYYSKSQSFNVTGRFAFVIMYADILSSGSYDLSWSQLSPKNLNNFIFDDKFYRFTTIHGQESWNFSMKAYSNRQGKHVIVINPPNLAPFALEIEIGYKIQGSGTVSVIGSKDSEAYNLIQSKMTTDWVYENVTSLDSFVIIVVDIPDSTADVGLDIKWRRGNNTQVPHYTDCGGTVIMEKTAKISHRSPSSSYLSTKLRCSWLVLCPYSNVTLTLVKQRLCPISTTTCPGKIGIDTIDSENGNLNTNSTLTLQHLNETVSVSGPLIVVTFVFDPASDPWSDYKAVGFSIELNGSGEPLEVEQSYRLIHSNGSEEFDYSTENIKEKIIVLAYNDRYHRSSNILINFYKHHLNASNVEYNHHLVVYSYANNRDFQLFADCLFIKGYVEEECSFPRRSEKVIWKGANSDSFQLRFNYTGFLAIIKPFALRDENESSLFSLAWSEDKNKCGGFISSMNSLGTGTIVYKVYEYLDLNEVCIWLVDVSHLGHNKITFTLDASGTYTNDSTLTIAPILLDSGTLGTAEKLVKKESTYSSSYSYYSRYSTTTTTKSSVYISSSVAVVTLRTGSTGPLSYPYSSSGFKISFSSTYSSYSPKISSSVLAYFNPLINSEFVLSAQTKALAPNTTLILVVDPSRNMSISERNATFNLIDVNLFLDENCKSDHLYIYGANLGSSTYATSPFLLTKSFRSYKSPNETVCDHRYSDLTDFLDLDTHNTNNSTLSCQSECYETNVVSNLNDENRNFPIKVPFLVIYRSVSEQHLKKTLHLKWFESSNLTTDEDTELTETTSNRTRTTPDDWNWSSEYGDYN